MAVGSTTTALLYLKGENLTGSLSLRISGADRTMFTLDPSAQSPKLSDNISASLVNATGGYQLQVSYKPTSVGEHSAKISIYDGGLSTIGGNMVEEQIECDENSVVIDDYDPSVSEAYYVQSSRLGYLSEPSETKFVSQSGISNIGVDNPFSVESYPGTVRFRCAGAHTDVCIYDMTGRLVTLLPEITDGYELTLPYGIYLVRTAQHPAAVRIIAR